MSCLRQLQQLVCTSTVLRLSVLPAHLRQLELRYCWSSELLAPVMQLQQLTALSLKLDHNGWREYDLLKSSGFNMRKPLRRLRRLPALQELRLAMEWTSAVETASAWAQLPQLCDLEVRDSGPQGFAGRAPRQRLAAVVAQIGATTALTQLVLDVPGQGSFGLDEQQAAADKARLLNW
ncbi:hypothetical protein OEZ86_003089 [Tetradesmus obliquus]|nr:hypothetical protein OEZ86_003089 [Tetradesmus obliquus]